MSNQVRHAVSHPFMPRPIPHTRFGIRKPGIRNPLAPSMERHPASMERSRIFFPSPALFLLTTEHGAVWCVPT
jgi:hypothetical protein